ncbi:uncharacterized protein [Clytia hemisphaerica]|uniref:Uncharacterized protein n=1 Tax=Clytia hemisphaerica TaxID=252671 RepID=A0A7M5U7R7_9CNID
MVDIELKYEGLSRICRPQQVSVQRLAVMFKLVPATIYVREENGLSEFPNNGIFDCFANAQPQNPNAQRKIYLVEGEREQENSNVVSSTTGPSAAVPGNSFASNGAFRRLSATRRRSLPQQQDPPTYSLKVILADLDGKKIGIHRRMQFFNIDEGSANVTDITAKCRDGFGNENVLLVQANGLRIEDNVVTQTLAFWKSSARKVYAVDKSFIQGVTQQIDNAPRLDMIIEKLGRLESKVERSVAVSCPTSEDVQSLKSVIRLAELSRIVQDTYSCLICLDLMTSPVVFATCCVNHVTIIGSPIHALIAVLKTRDLLKPVALTIFWRFSVKSDYRSEFV